MAKQKKQLELKIVFDTNVIFTGSSSDLLKNEACDFLDKYSNTADLKTTWFLPEVVINERKFQMCKKGFELLPALEKLERIIGHKLAITKDIVEARIFETVSKQVEKYSLNIINLDINTVNWNNLINNACFRVPPFEDSDKEKGFRDAIILESILQLINSSPSTKSICRIILVTNDKLLQQAFEEKTTSHSNALCLGSLDELESLINVLSSQITEELINSIIKSAQELFFVKDDSETFYYKENIGTQIKEKYLIELNSLPPGATKRENGTWWIPQPGFVKKEKQKIFWKTTITVDSKAYKRKKDYLASIFDNIQSERIKLGSTYRPTIGSTLDPSMTQTSDEICATGKTKFEVFWSVILTTSNTLKNIKLEEIKFIETTWE